MGKSTLRDRTVWITGASPGIGRALAMALSGRGNHLVLTSRSMDSLVELADSLEGRVTAVPADIARPFAKGILREELDGLDSGLDTMILCAGDCEYVDSRYFDSGAVARMLEVNVVGMARCIEAGLPALRRSGRRPQIVGVSSASAITGLPRAEAYGASKAAVVSMLESLALDLHGEGIRVTVVLPGFVDTPLTRRNDFPMPFLMDAGEAAGRIVAGVEAGRRRIVFPRALAWPLRLLGAVPEGARIRLGQRMVRGG